MKQIAKRVYNNNVVLSENASGEEIILVGKGLAFGLNKGDLINTDKIGLFRNMSDEIILCL